MSGLALAPRPRFGRLWGILRRLLAWLRGGEAGAPPTARMRIGAHGEELAAKYLRSLGWKLIARNWRGGRDRRDELDIVARDGGTLVFVEVKTRTLRPPAALPGETPPAAAGCGAYEAVDARKRRVLARAVCAYLGALPRAMPHHRFDIVEVLLPPPSAAAAPPEIRHHRAIPLFSRG